MFFSVQTIFATAILCLLYLGSSLSGDSCSRHDKSCESKNHNLYKKEFSSYYAEINKAKEFYKSSKRDVSCYNSTILNDLKPFKDGISKKLLQASYGKGVKFQLINHQLYRSKECLFPSRCSGVEYFINSLKDELPDFECVINFYDWPQVSKYHGPPLPVLSFSKSNEYYDIMYPAWSFWEGGPAIKIYPRGIGRWDLYRTSLLNAAKRHPWEEKKKLFFFRGSRTSSERDTLILLSRSNPELVNASYTKNQAWKSDKDTLGMPPADEVPFEDHCQYRYLFNFRGVAASFRFKYLFLCKSLVLHVGDDWKEFFYDYLKPWVHYIPVSHDATKKDYRDLMDFIIQEDQIAKEIAEKGFRFISNHLRMEDIFCYWKNLLLQYSSLLTFKPELDKSLIKVSFGRHRQVMSSLNIDK